MSNDTGPGPGEGEIRHDAARRRYELVVGPDVVSFADYEEHDGVRAFVHTLTEPRFRGHGYAEQVVRAALDDARRDGVAVVPACSYVGAFVHDHPAYQDLVAPNP